MAGYALSDRDLHPARCVKLPGALTSGITGQNRALTEGTKLDIARDVITGNFRSITPRGFSRCSRALLTQLSPYFKHIMSHSYVLVVQFPIRHPLTWVLHSLVLLFEDVYDEEMSSDAYDAGHYRIEILIPGVYPYTDTDI
jgi:hypothetical protein